MASRDRTLLLKIVTDANQTQKSMKNLDRQVSGFTRSAKKLALAAGAGFGLREAGRFISGTVREAANLEESINAVNVVFGDAADTVLDFSGDATDAVFETQESLNTLATVTGSIFKNFGFSASEAADRTVELSRRAADMASVFNVDVSEALGAINSGLSGQSEPLRRFGVDVRKTAVEAFALEKGLIGSGQALDSQTQALATALLILEQTKDVQGDAANTADSYANRMRALNEQWANAKVTLGEGALPLMEAGLELLSKSIPVTQAAAEETSGFQSFFLELGANLRTAFSDLPGIVGETEKAARNVRREVASGADVVAAWAGQFSNIEGATNSAEDFVGVIRLIEDGFNLTRPQVFELTEAFLDQGQALGLTYRDYVDLNRLLIASRAEFSKKRAQEAYTQRLEGLAEALDTTTTSADNTRNALVELANAQLEATDPALKLFGSMDRLTDVIADIDEDGKRTTEELVKLGRAQLEANAAFQAFQAANPTAGLQALADAAGVPLEVMQELFGTFQALDGMNVTATINLQGVYSGAFNPRDLPPLDDIFSPVALHTGGIVKSPTLTYIGEAGAEAVVPLDKGGVGFGGPTYNVNVEAGISDPSSVARAVIDAIQRYEGQNGASFREAF